MLTLSFVSRQNWPVLVGVVLSHLACVIFFVTSPVAASKVDLSIIDISFDLNTAPAPNRTVTRSLPRPPVAVMPPLESATIQQPSAPMLAEVPATPDEAQSPVQPPAQPQNEPAQPINTASQPDIQPLFKLTRMPSFSRKIEAVYPAAEKRAGVETTVLVEVTIDAQGQVLAIRILKSGGTAFDDAVKASLTRSTFNPGMIDGRAVGTRFQIPFRFNLN